MKRASDIQAEARAIRDRLAAEHPELAGKLRGIDIATSTRMTRSAGNANYARKTVKLSVPFFADEHNFETHLENTVKHELAHLLAGQGTGHGPAWRAMHRRLGGTAERTHDMALSEGYANRRAARVEVPCARCGGPLLLGPRQQTRHREGARYAHRRCPG